MLFTWLFEALFINPNLVGLSLRRSFLDWNLFGFGCRVDSELVPGICSSQPCLTERSPLKEGLWLKFHSSGPLEHADCVHTLLNLLLNSLTKKVGCRLRKSMSLARLCTCRLSCFRNFVRWIWLKWALALPRKVEPVGLWHWRGLDPVYLFQALWSSYQWAGSNNHKILWTW